MNDDTTRGLVEKQQTWLRTVLAVQKQKPTELARAAGMSPSILTRFLNDPEYPHALSARTIAAIEKVTGFTAYELPVGAAEPDATVFLAHGKGAGGDLAAAVHALLGKHQSAWRLNRRTLERRGYLPGDILIVDQSVKPEPGDAVAAEINSWPLAVEKAATLFRVFHPPVLVPAADDATPFPPRMIDDRTVVVVGVVVGAVRHRPR